MKLSCAIVATALAVAVAVSKLSAAQIALPIYIEDNHAGSFYWLAEHLDLDEPITLLHFDAHSDASGVFDSDVVRRQLRRVTSRAERCKRLESWRKNGTVQCFNWIEPLMPSPIAEVIWIPPDAVSTADNDSLGAEAGRLLDGHLEAAPRADGQLRARYRVTRLEQLRDEFIDGKPLVATIDLDYFAGMPPVERDAAFERVWTFIAQRRNLRAITIAISRPYLTSDEEADALVQLALRASLSLPTARIHFEPFRSVANDRSRRAQDLRAQKMEVPFYDLTTSSPELRALLLAHGDRLTAEFESNRWRSLLAKWRSEAPAVRLSVRDRQPSTDNIWRVPVDVNAEINLLSMPWYSQPDHVTWVVHQPAEMRCNLTATRIDEPGFAEGAPPRPRDRQIALAHSGTSLSLEQLREFFDERTGCGAVRVHARATFGSSVRETPVMEVRRSKGSGFRAAVLEQFGLPYLFGGGELRDGASTGPETGWGADCANFLIYALRRQGLRIPWSDPKQFRNHLELLRQGADVQTQLKIGGDDLAQGLVIHLGTHVAAVMEDRAPIGVLDGADIVAHQLEGPPELLALGALLQQRNARTFDVLRVGERSNAPHLLIGGDVMLGRTIGDRIRAGEDPFAGLRELLARAGTTLINLECVVSAKGEPVAQQRFHLRAPVAAADALRHAGVRLIGHANNHAADFGEGALRDSVINLRAAGVEVIGAGANGGSAYAAHVFTTESGQRVAIMAVSDFPTSAPIATTFDRARLARAIAAANAQADFVIMFVHWGEENTPIVTERQRELARWFVDEGVDLVAGSHPHHLQSLDFYRGRPIAYSLGNLVFDGAPTVRTWNTGALLSVSFSKENKSPEVRLIPVQLDDRGFPQIARSGEVMQQGRAGSQSVFRYSTTLSFSSGVSVVP